MVTFSQRVYFVCSLLCYGAISPGRIVRKSEPSSIQHTRYVHCKPLRLSAAIKVLSVYVWSDRALNIRLETSSEWRNENR